MISDPFKHLSVSQEVLTVTQLNRCARSLLEEVFAHVWVVGELSNLACPASGHIYFTLKDHDAQIRCALFRQQALRVRELLRNGLGVKVYGKVSLFEGRGDYQLIIEKLEPAGDGALRLAFELLQKKLEHEGLFDASTKKPLPKYPSRIGIVSSASGAVIQDIISVFKRRAPQVELVLVPTAVQGQEAVGQLVKAIALADKQAFDAFIIARGGGSLEDLWCFNDEAVARAIAACVTPVISGVGHETDVTIADFVADLRAPTPSAAAELLAPQQQDLLLQLASLQRRLVRAVDEIITRSQLQLMGMTKRIRHPLEKLNQQSQKLDDLSLRLVQRFKHDQQMYHYRLQGLYAQLLTKRPELIMEQYQTQLLYLNDQLARAMQVKLKQTGQMLRNQIQALQIISPLATLERGYSILLNEQGQSIQDARQVRSGELLSAKLAKGKVTLAVVDNGEEPITLSLLDSHE